MEEEAPRAELCPTGAFIQDDSGRRLRFLFNQLYCVHLSDKASVRDREFAPKVCVEEEITPKPNKYLVSSQWVTSGFLSNIMIL